MTIVWRDSLDEMDGQHGIPLTIVDEKMQFEETKHRIEASFRLEELFSIDGSASDEFVVVELEEIALVSVDVEQSDFHSSIAVVLAVEIEDFRSEREILVEIELRKCFDGRFGGDGRGESEEDEGDEHRQL